MGNMKERCRYVLQGISANQWASASMLVLHSPSESGRSWTVTQGRPSEVPLRGCSGFGLVSLRLRSLADVALGLLSSHTGGVGCGHFAPGANEGT